MKKIQDISILSVSLVTGVATLLSAAIPNLALHFNHYGVGVIESLVTIPSLGAIVTIMLNSFLSKKIGIKRVVEIGILLALIAGIAPLFLKNLPLIFMSRILLGLGIGLYSPHAISLIALCYTGTKKSTFLGLQVGITAAGNALFLLLASIIVRYDWQWIYLLYLLLLPILLLVIKYVPELERLDTANTRNSGSYSQGVLLYLVLCFITFVIIYGVQLKIPTLFNELPNGNSTIGGVVLSGMNLTGFFAGIVFGQLIKKIDRWIFVVGYVGAALSVLALTISTSVWLSFGIAVFFNFIYSFTGPFIVLQLNTLADKDQIVSVNSWFTLIIIGSQFVAPIIWNALGNIGSGTTRGILLLIAMMLVVLSAAVTWSTVTRKRKT